MKNFKRIFFLLLAALMLTVCISADEYTEWTVSDDGTTLSDGDKVYTLYDAPRMFYEDAAAIYRYANYVDIPRLGGTLLSTKINASAPGAEIVWSTASDSVLLFATDKGAEGLDRFFAGEGTVRVEPYLGSGVSELADDTVDALRSFVPAEVVEWDVRDLRGKTNRCEAVLYDETDTFAYAIGCIYEIADEYWYLDYSSLSNMNFDADGNFSYRSGNVTIGKLDASLYADIESSFERERFRSTEYTWEDYEPNFGIDDNQPISVFWNSFAIIGFIIPAALAVLGAVLANRKKRGNPGYWYALTVICGVWIVFAMVLLMVLLIV